MKLDTQKRIAADVLKCSAKRVRFEPEALESISEAITKEDIRVLIKDGAISKKPVRGQSRVRANKRLEQKRKGRRSGAGTHKGKKTARLPSKEDWMNRVRAQRKLLKELKAEGTISTQDYRDLYAKSKGGFFRSRRHINLYIDEHNMRQEDNE